MLSPVTVVGETFPWTYGPCKEAEHQYHSQALRSRPWGLKTGWVYSFIFTEEETKTRRDKESFSFYNESIGIRAQAPDPRKCVCCQKWSPEKDMVAQGQLHNDHFGQCLAQGPAPALYSAYLVKGLLVSPQGSSHPDQTVSDMIWPEPISTWVCMYPFWVWILTITLTWCDQEQSTDLL